MKPYLLSLFCLFLSYSCSDAPKTTIVKADTIIKVDTITKSSDSIQKSVIQHKDLNYEVIGKEYNTLNEVDQLLVFVATLKDIQVINSELINNYKPADAKAFQIFYFNSKSVAKKYKDLLTSGTETQVENASKHVIAKYIYAPYANEDKLYTGEHSDDN